ncbi:MAG: acetyltransferase [Anaerolineaceae bacterium]|nr:acetyltransferase [Anaerolineaceae bacterium]
MFDPFALKNMPANGADYDPKLVIIYGGGGHAKQIIELLRSSHALELIGILDDDKTAGSELMGVTILGDSDLLYKLSMRGIRQAVNGIGGITNPNQRKVAFDHLQAAGFTCPPIVHPTAFVEPSARMREGAQVFAQVYVGSECEIGFGCLINYGAILSHDCIMGERVNVSPGAMLAGGVRVGEGARIGMGVTINIGLTIGSGALVGNGATVKADVPAGMVVHAGAIWPEPGNHKVVNDV